MLNDETREASMKRIILSIAVMGLAVGVSFAGKKEKQKISKDIPESIVGAVKSTYPDAVIKEAEIKNDAGKISYKFELKKDGNKIKLYYDKDGKLVRSKEEIAANALPEAVKQAVSAKYPKETIKEAKKLFKDNKTTYEVEMKSCISCTELRLDEFGKLVKKH